MCAKLYLNVYNRLTHHHSHYKDELVLLRCLIEAANSLAFAAAFKRDLGESLIDEKADRACVGDAMSPTKDKDDDDVVVDNEEAFKGFADDDVTPLPPPPPTPDAWNLEVE